MAVRKITFSFPADLVGELMRRVPASDRSRYVAEAIRDRLRRQELELIRACEVANQDPDIRAIEQEWEAFSDGIAEPWSETPPR